MKNYKLEDFTIGSDIEVFLVDNNETPRASIGIIKGTKENPEAISALGTGFAIQKDNVLCEFNIPYVQVGVDAEQSKKQFCENINTMLTYVNNHVGKHNLHYKIGSSELYPEEELQTEEANLFGCDPDFNAYTLQKNTFDRSKIDQCLRSAGTHLHIGYPEPLSTDERIQLIKYMDAYVGTFSTTIDNDNRRRLLYGKPGCFRITEYGVEYRTLGSGVLSSIDQIYDKTIEAINAFINDIELPNEKEVINKINGK